jgi:hypothetical protein
LDFTVRFSARTAIDDRESNTCFDDAVCFDTASTTRRRQAFETPRARAGEITATALSQRRALVRHLSGQPRCALPGEPNDDRPLSIVARAPT